MEAACHPLGPHPGPIWPNCEAERALPTQPRSPQAGLRLSVSCSCCRSVSRRTLVWKERQVPWATELVSLKCCSSPAGVGTVASPPAPHMHHTSTHGGATKPQEYRGERCHPSPLSPHKGVQITLARDTGELPGGQQLHICPCTRVCDGAPSSHTWNTRHSHNDILKSIFSIFLGNQDYPEIEG